jgi:HD superfamily phosphodiesterase
MSKLTTNQILALTKQVILPFHEIKRSHKLAIGRRRHENDVEHSWSVAVLACCLAPYIDPTLDLGKISQYAILHDSSNCMPVTPPFSPPPIRITPARPSANMPPS